MADKCVICSKEVDWSKVKEEFGEMLDQVDHLGEDSLTDEQQTVYNGRCCSRDCYDQL